MRKKLWFFLTCLMLSASTAFAQRSVTGTVTDINTGEPLIGVHVMVNGQALGITDLDGKFSLNNVPESVKTIEFSYMGYEDAISPVRPNIRIAMAPSTNALDDVVIVAYGSQRREARTGAVAVVKPEEIVDIPASSIDKMLGGKLAGVSITQQSGQPGSSSSIRIRGISSINAGNYPLWVVDGVPVMQGDQSYFTNTNNALAMINPDDIESITVLKDAAAAAAYGSRAANGVIIITTKSGKEGKSQIGVRAKLGFSSLANDNDFGVMTGQQLLSYQRQAAINAGVNPDDPTSSYYRPYELLSRKQTNWMDEMTRLGRMQEYEINLQGGSQRTNYYSSLSFHENKGIYEGTGFKKIQARINADHKINDHWKTGVRLNVGWMKNQDVPMQSLYNANPAFAGLIIQPWTPLYNEDGTLNYSIPENSNINPLATAAYDDQWEEQYRFYGNMYLEYKPIEHLTLKTTNAAEMAFTEGRRYWNPLSGSADTPTLQTSQRPYRYLTTSNTATYENTFADVHNFRAVVGQEASHRTSHYNYQKSYNLNPDIPYHVSGNSTNDLGYEETTSTLLSYFGIFDYNYDSRYYAQFLLREDGSSLFGKDNQWGLFWSASASWNIHSEKFMENVEWVNFLKLRASYGVSGNNNIGAYHQYGLYSTVTYNGITGMMPSSPANDKLSWEKNKSFNFGIDFTFFKRLSGSLDIYTRKTTDMLLSKGQSYTSGFGSAAVNIGAVRNSGIELQLDYKVLQNRDWSWDVGFNIAHNKSKVLDLAGESFISYSEDSRLRHIVGERMFSFWLKDYAGVNPVNGEALWRNEAGELTNDYNAAAYVNAGSPEPKYTGGINTTLRWKDLTLSMVAEFKGGNKVMIIENRYFSSDGAYMTYNQAKSNLNYWTKPGDTGVNPKPIAGRSDNSNSFGSTRFLENGGYFRIKDITLSYNLPKNLISRAGINNVKVYASGLNLYTFHKVNFWDPERGEDGLGYGIYPTSKTFVIGLDLTF